MLDIKIEHRLGGFANLNFLCQINHKQYIIKFLKTDKAYFMNKQMENAVKQMILQKDVLFNAPSILWKCGFFSIEEFIPGCSPFYYEQVKEKPEILGNIY